MINAPVDKILVNESGGRAHVANGVESIALAGVVASRQFRPHIGYGGAETQAARVAPFGAARTAGCGSRQRIGIDVSGRVTEPKDALPQSAARHQTRELGAPGKTPAIVVDKKERALAPDRPAHSKAKAVVFQLSLTD